MLPLKFHCILFTRNKYCRQPHFCTYVQVHALALSFFFLGLLSSVAWGFLNVWLRIRTILISLKLMKTSSLKTLVLGEWLQFLTILIRRENLTHGWYSHNDVLHDALSQKSRGSVWFGKKAIPKSYRFFGTPSV